MIDTSKLSDHLVKGIASNLGWEDDESIEPYLEKIAQMTPEHALGRYSEWYLGDAEWARTFIDYIDQLRKAEEKEGHALAAQLLEITRQYPGDSYKIKLIKALRELKGYSLSESKTKVEELFYFSRDIGIEPTIR